MKKLFLLLILLPGLALAQGSSTKGKETTVTWAYTAACDSAWMVFGYDGDAGDPDTANMYDSLKLIPCFSGTGKELCGDGLDLDSIGSHVVKMYCFSGDAVIGIRVGKWEQKAAMLTAANVWAEDTGGVALTKYGGAVLDHDDYKATGFAVAGDPMTLQADSLLILMTDIDSVLVLSEHLAHFWAACDLCYEIHFPADGTANKDSSYLINPGLAGSDTLVAKVEFKHSNVADVADSSYYYLNPWW